MRAVPVMVLAGALLTGCGVGSSESAPGMTCADGYVAHPSEHHDSDGCGPHGGGTDSPALQHLREYLDQLPDQPVTNEVCGDGSTSAAVGVQGACSHHGGVVGIVYMDGTRELFSPDGTVKLIYPDGTTREIPQPLTTVTSP